MNCGVLRVGKERGMGKGGGFVIAQYAKEFLRVRGTSVRGRFENPNRDDNREQQFRCHFFFCSSRNRSLGSISPYIICVAFLPWWKNWNLLDERERGESRNYVVKEGSWTKGEAVRLITNGRWLNAMPVKFYDFYLISQLLFFPPRRNRNTACIENYRFNGHNCLPKGLDRIQRDDMLQRMFSPV